MYHGVMIKVVLVVILRIQSSLVFFAVQVSLTSHALGTVGEGSEYPRDGIFRGRIHWKPL